MQRRFHGNHKTSNVFGHRDIGIKSPEDKALDAGGRAAKVAERDWQQRLQQQEQEWARKQKDLEKRWAARSHFHLHL